MDLDSVCLQPTDSCWIPLLLLTHVGFHFLTTIIFKRSHYWPGMKLTKMPWVAPHPFPPLQDRNVLKRAVVQCFKRPLVFHEAPLSGKGTKLVVLKNRVFLHLWKLTKQEHHLPNVYFWIPSWLSGLYSRWNETFPHKSLRIPISETFLNGCFCCLAGRQCWRPELRVWCDQWILGIDIQVYVFIYHINDVYVFKYVYLHVHVKYTFLGMYSTPWRQTYIILPPGWHC